MEERRQREIDEYNGEDGNLVENAKELAIYALFSNLFMMLGSFAALSQFYEV